MKISGYKLVSKQKRRIAGLVLATMLTELIVPLKALALTAGPSQPEFQGFTPLATTSLVDPFSGDFSYNIPLLEIDGYPLNLVYRATSNIEEEGSWVGYGWNVNVGTLNRMVRGLPDDMFNDDIKTYQNIKTREVKSVGVSFEPSFSVQAGISDGIGVSAGVTATMGFTKDDDNYTGEAVGVSVGAGVYAGVNAGPFSVSANAGVTLSANSGSGGTISTYAGFNAGLAMNEYFSVGLGRSVNRTFNTISGWEKPNVVGSFNISSVTREIQKSFINSVSNSIPQVTSPYIYSGNGTAYKLNIGVQIGLIENLGFDLGIGITVSNNTATTTYGNSNVQKGYGYMYYQHAKATDVLDFTRDNDGGLNKDMPFMPPAMKTYDVFSSTAHNASSTFRADRNDFGVVRDPSIEFKNTDLKNKRHELTIKGHMSFTCWLGISIKYDNIKTSTEGFVASGGSIGDMIPYRESAGKDQNLFFKACGSASMADDSYINQVNKYGHYSFNSAHTVKGNTASKRQVTAEPIAVYTNSDIASFPQTVVPTALESYAKNSFPSNSAVKTTINRSTGGVDGAKIGAILNTNKSGQTYVYSTPVNNNIKNEVAFRISGFDTDNYKEREGLMKFQNEDIHNYLGQNRDELYKTTVTPGYATSYLLNGVLSPDYVDVKNDGITDDDLGGFVKFNYTKTENDYRWRVPYGDKDSNIALLNEGVKVTKFDNMASYVAGSKQLWYAHSIESKNYVVEFYISDRKDAKDTRAEIMRNNHPHAVAPYNSSKGSYARMQKLDSIKYYYKHDRYLSPANAVPLKTVYFDYDYGISSRVPNADTVTDSTGKLRLVKLRVRHGDEPLQFAETYNLGYTSFNPAYNLGDKDGWGNYCSNNRPIPLCEFPYIDQENRINKDRDASAFHLNYIGLPSGGKIDVEYEADDYSYVQNKRAMSLTEVAGVGNSQNLMASDVFGLYDGSLRPFLYIYVKKPSGLSGGYKSYLLNGSDLMYFSFNINIAGNAFSTFDQVKGYAEVEDIGQCPNDANYLWVKVKAVDLTGTQVKPSPMTNTAINMARAFATDQLYFQQTERPDGKSYNHMARLKKAAIQVADALLGKNSVKELMKDYRAGHKFVKNKSYVKLAMTQPKIGGGSRVSRLTFNDDWNTTVSGEASSLIGYKYIYKDESGMSSGVASYEPTLGGEENPMRSGTSYKLQNNTSKYPPYDPVEMIKEDPAGESFLPTGSVGYSMVTIESIHKDYARSAQSKLVQQFYTSKDFPYVLSFGPKSINEVQDKDYPNPGVRDILLSFLGVSNTISSSRNSYEASQSFLIETNDMHGKPKATYNYRLLPKSGKQELVNSTEYFYHNSGNRLSNEVDVLQHESSPKTNYNCLQGYYEQEYQYFGGRLGQAPFPKPNLKVYKKTLGVDIDVCTDSREVVSTETREMAKKGGGLKICIPPMIYPKFNWIENTHKHIDYFKSTITTKIVNRYGILKSVRTYDEGAETIVENKYYDAITGSAVVQVVKDKYGDDVYSTNVPGYWTKTDLEPSYLDYPFLGNDPNDLLPSELQFKTTPSASIGFLKNYKLLQASFITSEDIFHPGDELFVRSGINNSGNQWNRLYVVDVLVKKLGTAADPDPLSMRYGSGQSTGAEYKVFVTPYKVTHLTPSDFKHDDRLTNIQTVFRYKSGRKNMLDVSAGNYQSYKDPYSAPDSVNMNGTGAQGQAGCFTPSFLKPVINATASKYLTVNSILDGHLDSVIYNPVSEGILNQPYIGNTYLLYGDRKDESNTMQQRKHGTLPSWYFWLPDRSEQTTDYVPLKSLLTDYGSNWYNTVAFSGSAAAGNARWIEASAVTKSIPSLGPVEEKNAVGIYSSIFVNPTTKKVMSVTANGKFGQTWTETFEDLQQIRKYNQITDLSFSPFQRNMAKSTVVGYDVFNTSQSIGGTGELSGSFTLDKTQSHTGLYSLQVTGTVNMRATPKRYTIPAYYTKHFNYNLDDLNNNKYTYEVWMKDNGGSPTAPSVTSGGTTSLAKVSTTIDGWTLYRATVNVNDGTLVTFTLPAGIYDDLRVYPAAANVKTYVYHPTRTYLMAILDENNYATYYEYNSRNQLTRLKKETEKGVITITENIKNYIVK